MAILTFQHWDTGKPGRLGLTFRDHGLKLDIRRPDLDPNCVPTDLDDVHGLIILGGPQNVTDINALPWMQRQADLIRKAHAAELPIIGICLGAQLIAHALGGTVAPRAKPSIGFEQMNILVPGQTETLLAGVAWQSPQLFSCGQEITALPPGATLLANTASTKHVIFKAGIRTFASIAHFECDKPMAQQLIADSAADAAKAGQTMPELYAQLEQHYANYARLSDRLSVNLATYLFSLMRRLAS